MVRKKRNNENSESVGPQRARNISSLRSDH